MGGRGGRSHGGGGGGQQTSYAQYAAVNRLAQSMGIHLNLNSLGQNNINPMYIQETLQSVQFIYTHFPVMAGRVQYIDANVGSSNAYASAGGDGGLHMGLYGRMTPQALARQWAWDVRTGFHPQGTQASGIFVHEMGHQVEAYLNRRDYGDAWAWGRSSSDIVLQAAKRIDPSNANAKPLSVAIWEELKRRTR